jgi:alpha-tubulin suppressor-like RCC1 family protein
MNISNLQILLQESINQATDTIDWLLLSKALESLRMGQIRTVATYANLPDAATNEGLLVFVTADERLYWSTGTDWYNLIDENRGLAWSWGENSTGQLGNNTTTNVSSPISVVGGFTDWCQISSYRNHNLALRSNGTLWGWGCNDTGQLGNNTTTSRSSPVSVVGGFSDWSQVNTGGGHSLALRSDGSLWSWGGNTFGQLGDNTTANRSSPVSVAGVFSDWCHVNAGFAHSLAIRTNGTLWAWGLNSVGMLGDDTITNRSSPVLVVGGFTDWCQVSAGYVHSVAVRTNGTLWAWGCNDSGRLGNNTTTNRSSPVSVVGGFTDWCQVSAGGDHSLAIRTNGTLWAWGYNGAGRLGDNTITTRSSPVSIVGGFTDWCQVSAGYVHSVAVRTNGTLWAWGCNDSGRLGNNTTTNRSSPVSVVGGFTDWCQVSAGCVHSSALRKTNFT